MTTAVKNASSHIALHDIASYQQIHVPSDTEYKLIHDKLTKHDFQHTRCCCTLTSRCRCSIVYIKDHDRIIQKICETWFYTDDYAELEMWEFLNMMLGDLE